MIIVQLKGGLGNQLFQYAAALSLSLHHKVPVKVDVSLLLSPDEEINTMRHYELQHFIAPPQIATQEEINALTQQSLLSKIFSKFSPPHKRTIYKEPGFNFDEHFFDAGKNIYLKGYRQSEHYFLPYESTIRNQFRFKKNLVFNTQKIKEEIKNCNSVSVHIRRGDFTQTGVQEYHGVMDEHYYNEAIKSLSHEVENPVFYIFSDNIDWVKNNLKFGHPVIYISGNYTNTHYEDFYLMSQCSHNIIANSSFSWWAAWLNDNPRKQVIAPKKWFDKAKLNTKDLIPHNWKTI